MHLKYILIVASVCTSCALFGQHRALLDRAEVAWAEGDFTRFIQTIDSVVVSSLDAESQVQLQLKLGKAYLKEERPVRAIQCFGEVLRTSENPEVSGEAAYLSGEIYFEQKSYAKAREYYAEALRSYEEASNPSAAANARFKTAVIHARNGHEDMAQSLLLAIARDPELDDLRKTYAYKELGLLHFRMAEFDSCRHYLEVANVISRNYQLDDELLENYEWIMRSHLATGDIVEARASAEVAASIAVERGHTVQSAKFFARLAELFAAENDLHQAVTYQELAANYSGSLEKGDAVAIYYSLADYYAKQHRDADALLSFLDAENLAQDAELSNWRERIARRKAQFLGHRGRYEEAFAQLFIADSLQAVNTSAELSRLKRQAGNAKFGEENYLRIADDRRTEIEESRFSKLHNLIIIGLVFFTIIIVLLLREFSQKRKLSKVLEWKVYKRTRELRKANKELNTYIYKSSHDLRTPLTSIKSLLRLLEKEEHNASTKKYLGLIASCTDQMDDILVNLSRAVDYKKVDVKVEQIDFNKLRYQALEKDLANLRGIQIQWDIQENGAFYSDFKLIKVILEQTIQNAVSYRKGGNDDYCKVSVLTDNDGARLRIEDNGLGIPEKVRDKVFDMFVKGTHKSTGAGLGLYLVRIAAEKIRATVNLQSEENEGSILTFDLPNLN